MWYQVGRASSTVMQTPAKRKGPAAVAARGVSLARIRSASSCMGEERHGPNLRRKPQCGIKWGGPQAPSCRPRPKERGRRPSPGVSLARIRSASSCMPARISSRRSADFLAQIVKVAADFLAQGPHFQAQLAHLRFEAGDPRFEAGDPANELNLRVVEGVRPLPKKGEGSRHDRERDGERETEVPAGDGDAVRRPVSVRARSRARAGAGFSDSGSRLRGICLRLRHGRSLVTR